MLCACASSRCYRALGDTAGSCCCCRLSATSHSTPAAAPAAAGHRSSNTRAVFLRAIQLTLQHWRGFSCAGQQQRFRAVVENRHNGQGGRDGSPIAASHCRTAGPNVCSTLNHAHTRSSASRATHQQQLQCMPSCWLLLVEPPLQQAN